MTLHRIFRGCAIGVAAAAAFSLVLYFPSLTEEVLPRHSDWSQLSDIGQAYGGSSAVLSAVALCGISLSLFLQYRQHRAEVLYSLNQRHFDLVRYTLEHPLFAQSWGEDGTANNYELRVFCNLIMTHWRTLWRIGDINEETLHRLAQKFFKSEVCRDYWTDVGPRWVQ